VGEKACRLREGGIAKKEVSLARDFGRKELSKISPLFAKRETRTLGSQSFPTSFSRRRGGDRWRKDKNLKIWKDKDAKMNEGSAETLLL